MVKSSDFVERLWKNWLFFGDTYGGDVLQPVWERVRGTG